MYEVCVLIMAGGIGERFWPLSKKTKPKQLLNIFSDKTMIRETYERILSIADSNHIFIATNNLQHLKIMEEIPEIPVENFVIEPYFKDTAAAIGYGTTVISNKFPSCIITVVASDHVVKQKEEFVYVINKAIEESKLGSIITLGIIPKYPETGYGYIEVANVRMNEAIPVLNFKEKPNYETAENYCKSGRYLWNSGMFIFRNDVILQQFQYLAPSHFNIMQSITDKIGDLYGTRLAERISDDFNQFEKKSIDYLIMEKSNIIKVIPSDFGWHDIGSYLAFDLFYDKDDYGNIIRNAEYIQVDSYNNIIISDSKKLIASIGISNSIIVCNDNELLVCNKADCQNIKALLSKLGKRD